MKLRPLFAVLPVLVLLKLTACADNDDPNRDIAVDDGGGADGPVGADGGADGDIVPGKRGSCAISKEGTAGVLIGGRLLLPDGPIDGEVFIDATGNIQCAAKSCAATPSFADDAKYQAAYKAATAIVCKDAVISPGLINPHDHISFANTPPLPHGTERYEHRHDWRKGIRGHKKLSTWGTGGAVATELAELRFVLSGATTTAGTGGTDGLLRNVDTSIAQLEGVKIKSVDSETFPLGDSTPPASFSAPFPPPSCDGYSPSRRKASSIAAFDGFLPHISEGVDEEAHMEFLCQSNLADDPEHFLLAKQTAIVHGVGLNAADIAKYHGTQTALIWSPRSNIDLYGNTAPVVEYDNLGVQIALGTDWLPSGSMNMSRELRCADDYNTKYLGKHFSEKQLWQMVTQNAAFSIGAQNALGALKPGYAGDIAIFSAGGKADYRAVIDAGVEDVILTMRGGKALYGDANLLGAKGLKTETCEDLDVCGVKKKACVKQDLGKDTLQVLLTATVKNPTNGQMPELLYPLFFCKDKTPKNEPSCTPSRGPTTAAASASKYTGTASGSDKDGDGIEDAKDNCPSVFNPIRPMDGDKQGDGDGDGIGDACDKCPLDKGETCTAPKSDDLDDDGVPNDKDNCPELANADQKDDDKDGKGNACDACPTDGNPGQLLCAITYTVEELRDPTNANHPAAGTVRAKVKDLYVTGVRNFSGGRGFTAQVDTGGVPVPFSGIFIATAGSPTVSIGNKVDVEGDYEEAFGITTLANATVKVTDAGTTLPFGPVPFSTADIIAVAKKQGVTAEQYESMLIELPAVTVTIMNADALPAPAKDFDEFVVDDGSGVGLRVDDFLYDALENNYPVDTAFTKIVGVCGFSFSNVKIYPRSAADLPQ